MSITTIKKIVTHAGTFHADECVGVALLLHLFPGTPVERTYTPSEADFSDPLVVVLDIGRRYEPLQSNFDHHQDGALPAANMLILRHFYSLDNPRLAELLENHFFGYISDVDTGKIVEGADTAPTINGIIRACNNLHPEIGFQTAIEIMSMALKAQIATALRRIDSESIWRQVEINGQVAIHDSTEFIVGWHELAVESNVNFLVTPNLRGGYQITSRESSLFPIPPDIRQTFLHNSRFIAAYPSKEDAVSHAMSL